MENVLQTVQAQFANDPSINTIIEGFNQAVDPSELIDLFYDQVFNPQTATGWGLDVWGRIVGVSRVVQVQTDKYFGFQQAAPSVETFKFGSFFTGVASTQNYALSDTAFRQLIFAKALANISDNSVRTLNALLMALFPNRGRAYVKDLGAMQMAYVFEWQMTAAEQAIAISSGVLPRPSGTQVSYQILPPDVNYWRPAFHISPQSEWMNDVQRPLSLSGQWCGWYLWNADYPTGNGTAWREITSSDGVNWSNTDLISIPKYQQDQGDPWTGSTVIDTNNTAGFGAGAIIAIVTMSGDSVGAAGGAQSTFLWYATDISQPFSYYGLVQENPNANVAVTSIAKADKVFRDPSVFWDTARSRWCMVIAQYGNKIGFYSSPDFKVWTEQSQFDASAAATAGVCECPNLVQISNGSTSVWALIHGGNTGCAGTYYWLGTFDGTTFSASVGPVRLDAGPDCYASAVWQDSSGATFTYAWANNWAYASACPTSGYYGQMTLTRQLTLNATGNALLCSPCAAQDTNVMSTVSGSVQTISDTVKYSWPNTTATAYRLDITFTQIGGVWPTVITLSLLANTNHSTVLLIDPGNGQITFRRSNSGTNANSSSQWMNDYVAKVSTGKALSLSIFVDNSSIEIFANNGEAVLTGLVFPPQGAAGRSLTVSGGSVVISSLDIKGYA